MKGHILREAEWVQCAEDFNTPAAAESIRGKGPHRGRLCRAPKQGLHANIILFNVHPNPPS